MIYVIITSYGEPASTIRAVKSFLCQRIKQKIIVVDPFPKTEVLLKAEFGGNENVDFFLDSGEGKSYALNILLEKIYSRNTNNIIILTDGDVYVSENSVQKIIDSFQDEKVGCVTGKPVSLNDKREMFGYWSHLLFEGIRNVRKELSQRENFLECSGYFFAIRNGVLQGFPLNVSEDSIIPYLFFKKGYKIKYIDEAEVYVSNPSNWKEWKKQKIRNIKGHENLNKLTKDMPRTKSFFNEIKKGTFFALSYPETVKELYWTILLFGARFYIYLRAFYDIKLKKKKYEDAFRTDYC